MSGDILLSDRERAEGFLPDCVAIVHTSLPTYEHERERAEGFLPEYFKSDDTALSRLSEHGHH